MCVRIGTVPNNVGNILARCQITRFTESSSFKVEHLKGAMTNEVYGINWHMKNEESSRNVLVRLYREGVELFFNRDEEIQTFESMSKLGFGPHLLGQFPKGRIEQFIHARDYEYASYNPVAYDIANHFCKMAADYHSEMPHIMDYGLYPGIEERHRFIHAYLNYPGIGHEPNGSEIEKIFEEAEKYSLAVHIFWGLWGIISAYMNNIEFDYLEYARQRLNQYWFKKPQLLAVKNTSIAISY